MAGEPHQNAVAVERSTQAQLCAALGRFRRRTMSTSKTPFSITASKEPSAKERAIMSSTHHEMSAAPRASALRRMRSVTTGERSVDVTFL